MMYPMWLALSLAWFNGTHTASVWGVYREELRRLDGGAAERRTLPPRPLPPAPPKR
jgi:hypothetical protein